MAKTYKALLSELSRLSKAAERQRKREIGVVVGEILEKMREYDISLDDLRSAGGGKKPKAKGKAGGRGKGAGRGRKGRKVAPKYRDPKTKATWSGRGLAPRWLAAYEKEGKSRDEFLITRASKK